MSMSPRDRILAAIHHQPVDRVPADYWGTPEITDKLCEHLGCTGRIEMYDRLGIDGILGVAPPCVGPPLPNPEAKGYVDNQHTLPHGTPDDMRAEVRWLIGSLAADRTGYILAPCHNIQAITPVENVVAMYEATREYGTFGD